MDIRFENVTFQYEGTDDVCLSDLSLHIPDGQFVVLTGKSGCGKTTTTRLINGLAPHFYQGTLKGSIWLGENKVSDLQSYEISRFVGSVFQDPRSQFFTTNTTDELAFGCENLSIPSNEIQTNVEGAFSRLGMMALKNRSLFQLSSGEKQKIALASAYAMQPDVYVLDEPSANLDATATMALKELLQELKRQGNTVIISEHRLSFLMDIADRILYIDEGGIRYDWAPQELRSLTEAERITLGLRALDNPKLTGLYKPFLGNGSAVLDVRQICTSLGGTTIFKDTSFSLGKGEILGITGENGIGKTTLARTLCGICKESGGEVWIDGRKTRRKQRTKAFSFVMQDTDYQLFTETVEDELRFGNTSISNLAEKTENALLSLDLMACRKRHPLALSGGQKQRVTIAAAAVSAAPFIIFDEPTSGLDGEHMRSVGTILREIADQGKTLLVISHDTEFLRNICDRIFLFK